MARRYLQIYEPNREANGTKAKKKGIDGKTGLPLPKAKPIVKTDDTPFIYDGASNTIKSEKQFKTEIENTPVKTPEPVRVNPGSYPQGQPSV